MKTWELEVDFLKNLHRFPIIQFEKEKR